MLLFSILIVSPMLAADPLNDDDLDLDALMGMDVQATSAMKRAQSAFDTASSIYVLSKEQIVSSGATSIPEALRMVPGLAVRQLDNNQWAISARGVASRYSGKLLVMIDGQSLYTPKFAAVYWESLHVPLYDIERIEVIRGQGGLLWGSNANNGVINIITKNSIDTRNTFAKAVTGNQINADLSLRHGGDIANIGSYRAYINSKNTEPAMKGTRIEPSDFTKQESAGFRTDFTPNDEWSVLVQGDYTHTEHGQNLTGVIDATNGAQQFPTTADRQDTRLMARVEHRVADNANQMLQMSWLKQHGEQPYLKEDFESLDIDYQMNFITGDWQIDWGLNYRVNDISFADSIFINSDKDLQGLHQYGAMLQAQYNLIPDKLNIIVGTKIEHNDLTGWENQPLARFTYQPTEDQLAWGSISRSVRIPTLVEYNDNFRVNGLKISDVIGIETGITEIDQYRIATFLNGNDKVTAENYTSYELGYRLSKSDWSLDVSAFTTNAYDVAVISLSPHVDDFLPALNFYVMGQIPQAFNALQNTSLDYDIVSVGKTTTSGADLLVSIQLIDNLSSEIGYSYTDINYDLPFATRPTIGYDSVNRQLFSKIDYQVAENHSIFATLRVENSSTYNTKNYTALDLTWNWQINNNWTAAVSGKNLFAGSHIEYGNTRETFTVPNYIDECVTFSVSATF
ncbi:hypothetical protein PESP_b0288 [Pseudoalteromonas espejiana DSM 9414]|nr:hypothetical protein PESP_b0288 [Pseudoalteromonas espejiana DSM 9414]